jgi:5-methylthioadenosine/S-adenosylhomocysteine deaminase
VSDRILIRGGCVLTFGDRTPNHTKADVLVENGVIREVGPELRARDAEVIDATDTVVMPGFIDAHRHVWQTLLRNIGDPHVSSLAIGSAHGPDDIYAATLVGLLSAAAAGITTVVDWADIPEGDEFTEAALQAHTDAHLRTVFVQAPPTWGGVDVIDENAQRRIASKLPADGLTTLAHGSGLLLDHAHVDRLADAWAVARDLGIRIHAHAGIVPSDAGVVAELATRGVIRDDVTLIHGSHLSGADLDATASSGASIVLTPSTEMTAGRGSPPIQSLIDRRIRPGLGVDNDREAPGDLFAQMRATISLQHATYFDLRLAGKAGLPNLMTTRQVIRHATVDGARALGLGSITGSLEPGHAADIVVLRADRPNIVPVNDPIGAVVWGMDTSNVDHVLVGGRIVVRDGAIDADLDRARHLAGAAQRRVVASAGLVTASDAGRGS